MPAKDIIVHLNNVLKNELTSINQYFLHSRIFGHQGYTKLAAKEYEESIDEMKHADVIIKRILFLGGLPNLQDLGKIFIGESVPEMLQCDLKMEEKATADLRAAIIVTEAEKDFTSADILHAILASEEDHIDWLTKQLHLIEQLGLSGYLQTQV